MLWTHLATIDIPDFWPPKLRKAAGSLNLAIGKVIERRQGYDDRLRASEATDPAETDPFEAIDPNRRLILFEILQEELRVRRDVARLDDECRAALSAARDKAIEQLASIEAEVRKRLLSIGYVEPILGKPIVGAIWPGMIRIHPEVYAARQRQEALARAINTRDAANARAIEQIEAELRRLRQ